MTDCGHPTGEPRRYQVRNEGGGVATWQIVEMLGEAG